MRPAGGRYYLIAKRTLDITVSLLLLIVLLPLLPLIALAILILDSAPVLYQWKVVGKGGRPFTGYKFRTMVAEADKIKNELLSSNEMSGPVFKMEKDPRITLVGKYLRKYSLDELPQLWSVLRGHMSLVGPRPPLLTEYEQFTDWQRQKLLVKPGITCLWQISGRSAVKDFDRWVELDLEYMQRRSFSNDLKILFKTVPVVLLGTGR